MSTVTVIRSMTSLERDLVPMGHGFMSYWGADRVARRRMFRQANATYREFRADFGYADSASLLTDPESQPKTGKNEARTLTLMLVPARSVLGNACPAASVGCGGSVEHMGGCLNSAGHGAFDGVQYARLVRMAFLVSWPWEFGVILAHELQRERVKHEGTLGFRFNCVSDIRLELCAPDMLHALHASGFAIYDYSAYSPRMRESRPDFYHVTFSAKETHTDEWIVDMVTSGHNVAVPVAVRKGDPLPSVWRGLPAIDGDLTDFRPGDPSGVVVLLRAKGDAINDMTGFVRSL